MLRLKEAYNRMTQLYDQSQCYAQAYRLYECSQYKDALKMLNLELTKDPAWVQGLNLRGLILGKKGEHTEADRDFLQVTKLLPDWKTGWYNLATNAFRKGKYLYAISYLSHALSIGHDPFLLADRGLAHMRSGDYEQALRDLNAAQSEDSDPEVRCYLVVTAQIYEDQGEPAKALAQYQAILDTYKETPHLLKFYAALKIKQLSPKTAPVCKIAPELAYGKNNTVISAEFLLLYVMDLTFAAKLEMARTHFQRLLKHLSILNFIPFEREVVVLRNQLSLLDSEEKPEPALLRMQAVHKIETQNAQNYRREKAENEARCKRADKYYEQATTTDLSAESWDKMIHNLKQAAQENPSFLSKFKGIFDILPDFEIKNKFYAAIVDLVLTAKISSQTRKELLEQGAALEKNNRGRSFIGNTEQAKALLNVTNELVREEGLRKKLTTDLSNRALAYTAITTTTFLMQQLHPNTAAETKDSAQTVNAQLCRIEAILADKKLDPDTLSDLAKNTEIRQHTETHCPNLFNRVDKFIKDQKKTALAQASVLPIHRSLNYTLD